MAGGQIDPARLDGDALTQWYLRSPAEIEQERQAAAAQRYADFFGTTGEPGSQTSGISPDRSLPDPNGSQSGHAGVERVGPDGRFDDGVYRPGQDDAQLTPTAATIWNCPTCHGVVPPAPIPVPLLPLYWKFSKFPPPGGPPSSEEGSSAGNHPPQCAIQYDNDSNVCREVPKADARQRCWKSAADREAYCIHSKGEVGYPNLITK
jgi:hypothetical protein